MTTGHHDRSFSMTVGGDPASATVQQLISDMTAPSETLSEPEGAESYLVVRISHERFAIPLAAVEAALEAPSIACVAGLPAYLTGTLQWEGEQLSVFSPGIGLGLEPVRPFPAVVILVDCNRNMVSTESADAPRPEGAKSAHSSAMGATSNAADGDAAAIECNHYFGYSPLSASRAAMGVDAVEDVVQFAHSALLPVPSISDPHQMLIAVARYAGALVSVVDAARIADVCLQPVGD